MDVAMAFNLARLRCGEEPGCDQENFTIQKPCKKMTLFWLFNIATENGPFIDGLPIKNGDFP
jgi:hypothetical protein